MTDRVCGHCKENLPFSSFHKCSRDKQGYQQWCKVCRKTHKHDERLVYYRKRYHEHKDKYLNGFYKRFYNLSLDDYKVLESSQEKVCAICKSECSSGRRLAVDHDHTTGQVRGLLCGNCNKALGCFKDSREVLQKARDYLEKYEI